MAKSYDWESNIKANIFMLRVLGLWPEGDTYTWGPYMVYMLILTSVATSHTLFQAVNFVLIPDDLSALTGTTYILFLEFSVGFKVYYVITHVAVVKELLRILGTEMFQPRNPEQRKEIDTGLRFWQMMFKTFLFTCACTYVIIIFYPLMDRRTPGEKRLPFLAWYPYDATTSPLYEIAYMHQALSIGFLTAVNMNIDALVAAVNIFNGSQFDILCNNLRNLRKADDDVSVNLKKCVSHHKQILDFAEKSNKFLNWILFIQFIVAGVVIGLSLFQLTVVVPFSLEFYSLLCYACGVTMQNFMYCCFGNEVEVKSNKLSSAIMRVEWTEFSKDAKKIILFFLLRSQKPVRLSAFNLFLLSLDTFVKLMKTSWSYFALLHTISSPK